MEPSSCALDADGSVVLGAIHTVLLSRQSFFVLAPPVQRQRSPSQHGVSASTQWQLIPAARQAGRVCVTVIVVSVAGGASVVSTPSNVVLTSADTDEGSVESIGVVSTVDEVTAAMDVTCGVVGSKQSLHDRGQ